jgi:hypothetical protein
MKYRELLVSAAITLFVTIVAGILVWYLTRESKIEPLTEKLEYIIEDVATFSTQQTKIGFITIKLENTGRRPALDVEFVTGFEPGTVIRERQLAI